MNEAPDFDTVTVAVDGCLTLNRPAKLNPLSPLTLQELVRAAQWFDAQDGVRVVVVRGAGRAFTAGTDLGVFAGAPALPPREAADIGRQMADALEGEVETLARSLADKAALTLVATKRHVNAVAGQMVGIDRSWADADGLAAALTDPECLEAGRRYLAARWR